jgi:hypothetical protein
VTNAPDKQVATVRTGRVVSGAIVALVLLMLVVGCGSRNALPSDVPSPRSVRETVIAAGDIASCAGTGDEATAKLVASIDGTVIGLGDNAYPHGSAENFEECYDSSWGRFKNRTYPVPGNHEYETDDAQGYFGYFGEAAGNPSEGYYSYNLGGWHIVALNSNLCLKIGGCHLLSPQVRWLKADLAANDDKDCTLAYMHHPLFTSGYYRPGISEVKPLWKALYEAGADVVLSAHDHNYQRFALLDPDGEADPERGIRQFVVGTGGYTHYEIETTLLNSEVSNDETYGVLTLNLRPEGYDWRFVPVEGETFTDSGRGQCH